MKALSSLCLILCLSLYESFRIARVCTRAIINARGMIANRNETTHHYGPRSYYSPVVKEEQQVALHSGERSEGRVELSEGIIPTGPESLARIESHSNPPLHGRESDKSQHAAAARYFKIVEALSPNDMLLKFTQTAPRHVQEAAKTAIMNILGSLPNYALDAALITTNTKLANLLYQMQMTGYMFKNAEYRMSLTRGLRGLPRLPPPTIQLPTANATLALPLETGTTITGEATVRSPSGQDTIVDVEALTTALSKEIADLRQELTLVRNEREAELRANLLTYIQALPQPELMRLTADMSDEVVQAMELLVEALMSRLGLPDRQSEVVLQQSVGHLAQICMWQIVVGYKLRELEALERGVALD